MHKGCASPFDYYLYEKVVSIKLDMENEEEWYMNNDRKFQIKKLIHIDKSLNEWWKFWKNIIYGQWLEKQIIASFFSLW